MKVISFDLGIRNLAVCMTDAGLVKDWSITDILAEGGCRIKNCGSVSIERLVKYMLKYLNSWRNTFQEFNADVIAIEQQPSSRFCPNIKSKVLSHIMQSWFIEFGHDTITFVNPKAPKALIEGSVDVKLLKSQSRRYTLNKKLAIKECRKRLVQNEPSSPWIQWFDKLKKKDDASDSYLQAIYVTFPPDKKRKR